jgi:hypothetical protein
VGSYRTVFLSVPSFQVSRLLSWKSELNTEGWVAMGSALCNQSSTFAKLLCSISQTETCKRTGGIYILQPTRDRNTELGQVQHTMAKVCVTVEAIWWKKQMIHMGKLLHKREMNQCSVMLRIHQTFSNGLPILSQTVILFLGFETHPSVCLLHSPFGSHGASRLFRLP